MGIVHGRQGVFFAICGHLEAYTVAYYSSRSDSTLLIPPPIFYIKKKSKISIKFKNISNSILIISRIQIQAGWFTCNKCLDSNNLLLFLVNLQMWAVHAYGLGHGPYASELTHEFRWQQKTKSFSLEPKLARLVVSHLW